MPKLYQPDILTWRQYYNPLRLLTLYRIVQWLELSERGIFSSLQWFYRFIEKREPTLRAIIRRRQAALSNLTWRIGIRHDVLEEAMDPETGEEFDTPRLAQAKAQQETLQRAYESIPNLRQAILWLGMAEFRGFAHLEKHYGDGGVVRLEPVPQWNWSRAIQTKQWLFNKEALDANVGIEISPHDFIIRTVDNPADETLAVVFWRKNLGLKDWDAFQETYGVPPLFLTLPEGAGAADQSDFQAKAQQVISDCRGTLPAGADIKSVDVAMRGKNPFREHITYNDEQIVLTGTGGKLTMLNDPTGIGGGNSEVHSETFAAIAGAEGKEISEVFQEQLDSHILSVEHPGEEALAFFELAPVEVSDPNEVVGHAVQLKNAGWKIRKHQLEEKTGYELEEPAPPVAMPGMMPPGGQKPTASNPFGAEKEEDETLKQRRVVKNNAPNSVIEALAKAQSREFAGVRARLRRITTISDDKVREQKLRELRNELPKILKTINADPASEKVLREAMTAAFAKGLAGKEPNHA